MKPPLELQLQLLARKITEPFHFTTFSGGGWVVGWVFRMILRLSQPSLAEVGAGAELGNYSEAKKKLGELPHYAFCYHLACTFEAEKEKF